MTVNLSAAQRETPKNKSAIRYLDTITAYDLWSEVYDTDGNFLQTLDTLEMRSLLPTTLGQLPTPRPLRLVDLGCGTGRNTMQLLDNLGATVIGLDTSLKMLNIARSKIDAHMMAAQQNGSSQATVARVEFYDILDESSPIPDAARGANVVISTLVLEHIPLLSTFFRAATQMLKPGGLLLLTNMHSDMGAISQAGFNDPVTGEKVRATSFAHQVDDVVREAKGCGFEVVGEVLERGVDERMCEVLGPRARKWIGVKVWFAIRFRMAE